MVVTKGPGVKTGSRTVVAPSEYVSEECLGSDG